MTKVNASNAKQGRFINFTQIKIKIIITVNVRKIPVLDVNTKIKTAYARPAQLT